MLVHDDVTMTDVAGPVDVFHHANMFGAHYRTLLVSAGARNVRTSSGIRLQSDLGVDDLERAAEPLSTLIVPGSYGMLDKPLPVDVVSAVERLAKSAQRIASSCTGSFLLAEAGLLRDRRATTHWTRADRFRRAYPDVRVDDGALFVTDGTVTTAAGIGSGTDVALAFAEDDHGPEVARNVLWQMVLHMQRPGELPRRSAVSQAAVAPDRPLRALLDAIGADPARTLTLAGMSRIANASPRQLARWFDDELGTTPARYVEDLRIELAQMLLQRGRTVGATAQLSGFGTDQRLRRVFLSRLGISPSVYAARYTRP